MFCLSSGELSVPYLVIELDVVLLHLSHSYLIYLYILGDLDYQHTALTAFEGCLLFWLIMLETFKGCFSFELNVSTFFLNLVTLDLSNTHFSREVSSVF